MTNAAGEPPAITYGPTPYPHVEHVNRSIRRLIEEHGLRRICDIGGGRHPLLPLDYVQSRGLDYTLLDISQDELDLAPDGYRKVRADICDPKLEIGGGYDLVFSKMVHEHVPSGKRFHENILRILAPGGFSYHYFPTLFAFPFVVNRLLPERLASAALDLINPRDRKRWGKFPAFYEWSRGPTQAQIQRFERTGYQVIEYGGYYGHSIYYRNVPPLEAASRKLSEYLCRNPNPALTSFAHILLRKPGGDRARTNGA